MQQGNILYCVASSPRVAQSDETARLSKLTTVETNATLQILSKTATSKCHPKKCQVQPLSIRTPMLAHTARTHKPCKSYPNMPFWKCTRTHAHAHPSHTLTHAPCKSYPKNALFENFAQRCAPPRTPNCAPLAELTPKRFYPQPTPPCKSYPKMPF